jgi:hypothetical protein
MVTFSYACKEALLTEYEMSRARIMMQNNRIFQSLGINAIVSMIRKTNDQGSTVTSEESASVITQGESSDYNPRDDEDSDEEEVDNSVVEKDVKVQPLILFGGVMYLSVCLFFL